jgi:hypothetical protein
MNTKTHWPYGIIIAFILFCSLMISFVFFTSKNPEELVNKEYYKQEIAYQSEIDAMENTIIDQWTPSIKASGNTLDIHFPKQSASLTGQVLLFRPSKSSLDCKFTLVKGSSDQSIGISTLAKGKWNCTVLFKVDGKNYQFQQVVKL